MVSDSEISSFQKSLRRYYAQHARRDLPWRLPEADGSFDPYKILVSEIMLQQTQVGRVIPKYLVFLERFPDARSLADAKLSEVLTLWSGLGYNRRAKFLWQAAGVIIADFEAGFPDDLKSLMSLPGVGRNTAGALMAYAFETPTAFIETNIRTVYIHHFLADRTGVTDGEIQELLERSLPTEGIREFYWSLMDYGTYLKQSIGNLNRLSNSYAKQSRFEGSRRQIRGKVIRLLSQGPLTRTELDKQIVDQRLEPVLEELLQERMIDLEGGEYGLT